MDTPFNFSDNIPRALALGVEGEECETKHLQERSSDSRHESANTSAILHGSVCLNRGRSRSSCLRRNICGSNRSRYTNSRGRLNSSRSGLNTTRAGHDYWSGGDNRNSDISWGGNRVGLAGDDNHTRFRWTVGGVVDGSWLVPGGCRWSTSSWSTDGCRNDHWDRNSARCRNRVGLARESERSSLRAIGRDQGSNFRVHGSS
jgi:hypothetical protein